jgi:serine/threonine protein phosphatase 1
MNKYGLIGDIHGCVRQLDEVVSSAIDNAEHLVFLGDYVNRGPHSRQVLDYLIALDVEATFLAGNHDTSLLRALENEGFDDFLRIGGAPTVLSYISEQPLPEILSQFRSSVPYSHLEFLEKLEARFECPDLQAAHDLATLNSSREEDNRFRVTGHVPQLSRKPLLTTSDAQIDTGCGTLAEGRLTCFFWPSQQWIQSSPWDG